MEEERACRPGKLGNRTCGPIITAQFSPAHCHTLSCASASLPLICVHLHPLQTPPKVHFLRDCNVNSSKSAWEHPGSRARGGDLAVRRWCSISPLVFPTHGKIETYPGARCWEGLGWRGAGIGSCRGTQTPRLGGQKRPEGTQYPRREGQEVPRQALASGTFQSRTFQSRGPSARICSELGALPGEGGEGGKLGKLWKEREERPMGWARPARPANGRAGRALDGAGGVRRALGQGARSGPLGAGVTMTALSRSEAAEAGR